MQDHQSSFYLFIHIVCLCQNNEEENETKWEKDRLEIQRKENQFNDANWCFNWFLSNFRINYHIPNDDLNTLVVSVAADEQTFV